MNNIANNNNKFVWQDELRNKYPKMIGDLFFEHDKGWKMILDDLFQKIQDFESIYQSHEDDDEEYHPVRFEQIKEKFGGLRIYYSGGESLVIYQLVRDAEIKSFHTCETCGTEVDVKREVHRGWIYTRCTSCAEEILEDLRLKEK